jgi:hypothetical protein
VNQKLFVEMELLRRERVVNHVPKMLEIARNIHFLLVL